MLNTGLKMQQWVSPVPTRAFLVGRLIIKSRQMNQLVIKDVEESEEANMNDMGNAYNRMAKESFLVYLNWRLYDEEEACVDGQGN